MMVSA